MMNHMLMTHDVYLQDEEEEEEQRLSRVSQERQTTLDRLRSFRQVRLSDSHLKTHHLIIIRNAALATESNKIS